jgi:hypothetical protein
MELDYSGVNRGCQDSFQQSAISSQPNLFTAKDAEDERGEEKANSFQLSAKPVYRKGRGGREGQGKANSFQLSAKPLTAKDTKNAKEKGT